MAALCFEIFLLLVTLHTTHAEKYVQHVSAIWQGNFRSCSSGSRVWPVGCICKYIQQAKPVNLKIYYEIYIYKWHVKTILVPKQLQSWKVTFPKYHPVNYSWPCDTLMSCDPEDVSLLRFNVMDGHVDRRRAKGRCGRKKITVQNGLPLNPEGRTGVSGRGALSRWGPNHYLTIVILREENKEVQYLKKINDYSDTAHIFSTWFDNFTEGFQAVEVISDGKTVLLKNFSSEKVKKIIRRLQKNSLQLFSGNAPFHGNTDNSWLEVHAYAVFCTKSSIFCQQGIKYDKYEWKTVKQDETKKLGRSLLVSLNASAANRNEDSYEVFSCKPTGTKGMIQAAIGAVLFGPSLLATAFASFVTYGLFPITAFLPFLGFGAATAALFLVVACVLLGVGVTEVKDINKLSKFI